MTLALFAAAFIIMLGAPGLYSSVFALELALALAWFCWKAEQDAGRNPD